MLGKKAKNRRNIHTSVFVGAYCTDCVLFCGCFQPLTPIFFPPEGNFFLSRGKRFQLVSVSVLFLLLSFRISKALEIVEATVFHGLDGYTRMDNPFIICVNSWFPDKMQTTIRPASFYLSLYRSFTSAARRAWPAALRHADRGLR